MAKPRILLVLTEFPPSFGGMQTHAVHLCRHLYERGYCMEVATYRADFAGDTDRELPYPVHRCLSRIAYRENLRVLASHARAMGADLIYGSTVFYGILRELTGLPVVCRSPGNDVLRPWIVWPFEFLSSIASQPWIERKLWERFRRLDWPERFELWLLSQRRSAMQASAQCISRVLANSEYTCGLLEQIGVESGRIRVAAGGVDARRFRPRGLDRRTLRRRLNLPETDYLLMTACRLVPKKGLDLVMAALRRLPADTRLVVVGDGRERPRWERLAASLEVIDRVTFTGHVPHAGLQEYYWSADQFVLASRVHVDRRSGLRDAETMGRVLCEANAAGVPVVAARSGGIPSVIEDGANGLLFGEDTIEELVAAVLQIREDNRLAARLCERGLLRASREFDWGVIADIHECEFARALALAPPADGNMVVTAGSSSKA